MLCWWVLFWWQDCTLGSTRTRDGSILKWNDIDPVPSLRERRVSPSPSSLSSIAKAPGAKWEWIDCGKHMQSITCGCTRPQPKKKKNPHASLCCLCYQFSIMVKLKLSRFLQQDFTRLIIWLFCDSMMIAARNFSKISRKIDWKRSGSVCKSDCTAPIPEFSPFSGFSVS